MQIPIVDRGGQGGAVCLFDQRVHQIECRHAASTCHALAVDHIKPALDCDARELLGEGGQVVPMDRRAEAVEQARACQCIGAARDTAKHRTASGEAAQPCECFRVNESGGIAARTDEQPIEIELVARFGIRPEGDAVRRGGVRPVEPHVEPAIEGLARQKICRAQRFDRRRVGHQREAGQQQEAGGLRAGYGCHVVIRQ